MIRLFNFRGLALVLVASGMGACSTSPFDRGSAPARAINLIAADGTARGVLMLREGQDGAILTLKAVGMPAGVHGVHLHEKGQCEGPAFTSAGGHWNPTARKHGRENPAGAHLGDLPNFEVGASGAGTAILSVPSGAMMADVDGTALVVHAKADDYRTDPSGNSGDRIACAVIAPPR